jgi:protein TonB
MMMGPGADTTTNSRRTFAFFVVVAVHVLLIWGINAGLTDIIAEKVLGNLQSVEIAAPKEEEDKPPPPPPKMEAPPPFVPPPDIAIEAPPVENTTAIQVVTQTRPVEAPPPVAVRKMVRAEPSYDKKHPPTRPDYPSSELRAGHEGTVYLDLYVLVDGRIGEAKVKTSSGFARLDEAALDHVKRPYRLVPAMEDGKPLAAWVTLPIVFKIENR